MPAGFGYVFGQIVVLLLVALAVGVILGILGRSLFPRKPWAPDPQAVPAGNPAEAAARRRSVPTPAQPAATGGPVSADVQMRIADAEARVAYAETRQAQSEARRAELETRLAEAQTQVARATTGLAGLQGHATRSLAESEQARAERAQTHSQLVQIQGTLTQTRRQLTEADAEVIRLRLETRALADQKETEMGRLESGAIAALESTINTHQEQVTVLKEQLRKAAEAAEEQVHELAVERRRSDQLRAALAERDQHLASLTARPGDRPAPARAEIPRPQQTAPAPTTSTGGGPAEAGSTGGGPAEAGSTGGGPAEAGSTGGGPAEARSEQSPPDASDAAPVETAD